MVVDRPLVRLQCYEGLDESKALYEWKYGKQLLYTQLLKEQLGDVLEGLKDYRNPWRGCANSVMSSTQRTSSSRAHCSKRWESNKAASS